MSSRVWQFDKNHFHLFSTFEGEEEEVEVEAAAITELECSP
ncbi:MAG: hypothetical protein WC483_02120 [Candidatus Paceibacterota bacterium]